MFSESPPARDYHQMTVREPMLRQQPPRHSAAAARHRPATDFYERGRPVGYPYARSPIYSDDSGSVDEFRRPGYSSARYQGQLLFIVFEKDFCRRGRGAYPRRAQYDILGEETQSRAQWLISRVPLPSSSVKRLFGRQTRVNLLNKHRVFTSESPPDISEEDDPMPSAVRQRRLPLIGALPTHYESGYQPASYGNHRENYGKTEFMVFNVTSKF